MREWRKNLERESSRNGWATNAPQVPLYYECEVDCDGTFYHGARLVEVREGRARRNVAARRHEPGFGPGPGRLPG